MARYARNDIAYIGLGDGEPSHKRVRSDPAVGNHDASVNQEQSSLIHQLTSDYYDQIRNTAGTIETVYSSWLRPSDEYGSIVSFNEPTNSQADVGATTQLLLTDEITTLTAQLAQVKRRLAPAAQQCAEALNAYHSIHDDDQQPTTNSHYEFMQARRACNPLECLGEGRHGGMNSLFINRSAIKLANIDAILDFSLTNCDHGVPFRFVDLCGAPGGFSEYITYRCRQQGVPCTMGYGMSLTGMNENGKGLEWKIQEGTRMRSGVCSKYTICYGADGSGDIFQWDNVLALHQLIHDDSFSQTDVDSAGVQLIVADGGVDAQREQEDQEGITLKLVVCQVTAALKLLQRHGTFILKMFGFQTTVTRSLMKDLSARFESIRVIKPISSRPASAERYVVFRGFHGVPPCWGGQEWQNSVLLGVSPESPLAPSLAFRLDSIDRDMLRLNVNACFDILSYLEKKCMMQAKLDYDDERQVNIRRYKFAWRLT